MTTIHDVAHRAGVSVKTVSRILSGFDGVSSRTRARVETAMAELNYAPSAAARSLRGQGSGILGIIADNLTTTPDSVEIVRGVQSACRNLGKSLMIAEVGDDPVLMKRALQDFAQQRSEGLIWATMYHRAVDIPASAPDDTMLINCFTADRRFKAILPDDKQGCFDATRMLIDKGHRRIGYLTLHPDMPATRLRVEGYRQALKLGKIKIDKTLLRAGVCRDPLDEFAEVGHALEELLTLRPRPTAILCGNDKMAMRVMMLLAARGIRVPRDMSVVGFDDYQMITKNLIPKLTSVALPYFQMGIQGTREALGVAPAQDHALRCELVHRDSVAPPKD